MQLKLITYIFFLLIVFTSNLFSQNCNQWPLNQCIGNALSFENNNGSRVQFANVSNNQSLNSITTHMTVEMWIKPAIQSGHRTYLAGKWGPTVDKSDVWQLYFDSDLTIVFELNHPDIELNVTDNTIARTSPQNLNDDWHHIAAVFNGDSSKAYIYIDGVLQAEGTNPSYPISRLKSSANDTQFGRANELTNDNSYRTFNGLMDDIRLWNIARSEVEIFCDKDKRQYPNVSGLVLDFRCNENPGTVRICDAMGNQDAILLSGLTTAASDRPQVFPYIVNLPSIVDTVKCSETKTYSITVTDTSFCGSRARLWIDNDHNQYFDYSTQFVRLDPGVPRTFTFTFNADFVGTIRPVIRILRDNGCGFDFIPGNRRRWTITRITDLAFNKDTLGFGILKASCIEEPYRDVSLRVCNNSRETGNNAPITISSLLNNLPGIFQVISPSLPTTIPVDDCVDIIVRFFSRDTAATYYDTLIVNSNDRCPPGIHRIPMTGYVEQILSLTYDGTDGERIDSVNFGRICKGFPSQEVSFYWENLSSNNIQVIDVEVPNHFQFIRFNPANPQTLEPDRSYQVKLIRFVPTAAGDFDDSVVVVVKAGECTLRRSIYVKGRSIDPLLRFTVDTVDYGNVFVGQELERIINIENFGIDTFTVSFSISKGDVFYFPGGRFATIPPGEERTVRVRFRPLGEELYFDKLCFQETPQTGCYASGCITLRGQGIIDKFRFNPELPEVENVIACKDSIVSFFIVNEAPVDLDLSNFVLNDPNNKFEVLQPVNPRANLATYNPRLRSGDSIEFVLEYIPNDITNDRADKISLDYQDQDGEEWSVQVLASSAVPRLFMETNNAFGTLELGELTSKSIILENISPVAVHLDSIAIVGNGFKILYPPSNVLDTTLMPRDTIHLVIEFEPTQAINYTANILAYSSSPCIVENITDLTGAGKVVPLEIISTLITFGFALPCECKSNKVVMSNNSKISDAVISNIIIDDTNIPIDPYPDYFQWTSVLSPNGNLPYNIPPLSKDTLTISYCPGAPAIRDSLDHSAMLQVDSYGLSPAGDIIWQLNQPFSRFLSGKQIMLYEPENYSVTFPPTYVDNFAAPDFFNITIPNIDVNPDRLTLVIDSVTFEPEERVFFASDALGRAFPITYSADEDTLNLQIDFKPRVFKDYEAKVKIHFREPCSGFDTTLTVFGSGFASPFTLPFDFVSATDTKTDLNVISCDTLIVPIYASRKVPASIIDINCKLNYDNSLFEYLGFESNYLSFVGNPAIPVCETYGANVNINDLPDSRLDINLKNFCEVDSIQPIVLLKFKPKLPITTNTIFVLDSFNFDSEDVILFRLLTDSTDIESNILKSDFAILNQIEFDSVNVLECKLDTLIIQNTGDTEIFLNELIDLPDSVKIISINPSLDDTLSPGDIVEIIIEFCPLWKGDYYSQVLANVFNPCYMEDSSIVQGYGHTPLFELLADVSDNFTIKDTLYGLISEIVNVPIFVNEDVFANYNNTDYWLNELSFDLIINYDKFSLKFLQAENLIDSDFGYQLQQNGSIKLSFSNVDTLKAGRIAELEFLVTIPIDITSDIDVYMENFASEGVYFLELFNNPAEAFFNSGKSCKITHISYQPNQTNISEPSPNPWNNNTVVGIKLTEKTTIQLDVYDMSGIFIKNLVIASNEYEPGDYEFTINSENMTSGVYYLVLKTESATYTRKLNLIK